MLMTRQGRKPATRPLRDGRPTDLPIGEQRITYGMRTLLLALAAAVASPSLTDHASFAVAPCTAPTKQCQQWVKLAGGPARSMVFSTYSLDTPNPAITRALFARANADTANRFSSQKAS